MLNSAFNAEASQLIIIIVHVKAMRIYVMIVEVLTKKERHNKTQFTTKIDGRLSFTPPLNVNVCFCRFF
jgi:hypothetical protein